MISTILLCSVLVGMDPGRTEAPQADLAAYQAVKSQTGRGAEAQVRLALWCENHGMPAERMKHLALAVLNDPSNALARGLLGMVSYQGKWERPEVVGKRVEDDPIYRESIREYLERRAQAPDKAEAQLKLAAWCEQKELKAQAITHYERVTELDPSRDIAWKHLGYKKQGNRWIKPEIVAVQKQEADIQKHANKHWKQVLEKLRDDLQSKDEKRRQRGERERANVTDPRAVPMIWALFAMGSESAQKAAVSMLEQIEGPSASYALAALAIFSPREDVERRASTILAHRDLRDILTRLISMIRKPFKYQVKPVAGPGSMGVLFVEGEKFNVQRVYRSMSIDPSFMPAGAQAALDELNALNLNDAAGATPLTRQLQATSPTNLVTDPLGYLAAQVISSGSSLRDIGRSMIQLRRVAEANLTLQQRFAQDVQTLEAINQQIAQINERVLPIIETASGQKLGLEPDQWKSWWSDQLGYAFQTSQPPIKPTYTEFVDAPSWSASLECFGAGTLVHAASGPRSIETIHVGDRVLSQNPTSGALSYQPVMAVHCTKKAATVAVVIDREKIEATGIHRFWKAGAGWTMARDLKAGDRLRVVGGISQVESVTVSQNQTVYNLDIAENGDFFVGNRGYLVHDSKFVNPVSMPFDREPEIAPVLQASTR